jgi:pantothenate kinase
MKYENKRMSAAGKTIYQFSLGAEEMFCIAEILRDAKKKTPKTIDTMPFLNRIKNISKEISRVLKEDKVKIPHYSHQV